MRLAGTQAMSRGALHQAVQDFEAALGLLKALPDGSERAPLELQLLSPLGTAYIAVRGYAAPEVGPIFNRAREICDAIGEPQQQFAVVFGNFAWRVVRGEMDRSLTLAEEALLLAAKVDDPGMWIEALFLKGVTLFYRGDFAEARALYERALADYDDRELDSGLGGARRRGRRRHPPLLPRTRALAPRLSRPGAEDEPRDSASLRDRSSIPSASPTPNTTRAGYTSSCAFRTRSSCSAKSRSALLPSRAFRSSTRPGRSTQRQASSCRAVRSRCSSLRTGLDAYRATGAGLSLPYYLSLLGDAYTRAGLASEAGATLDEAAEVIATSGERCQEPELHRLRGELALSQGETAVAEEQFETAIAAARERGSKAWELRATISLGHLHRRLGRSSNARSRLASVYGSFTEGFDTPDLQEAKALLAAL